MEYLLRAINSDLVVRIKIKTFTYSERRTFMKRGYLFIALIFTVFMFLFAGNVSNADALGNYECENTDKKTQVRCLRGLLDSTPHGLIVPKGKSVLGKYGCGDKNKRKHINCLRRLLDQHGAHLVTGGAEPMMVDCQAGKACGGVPPMSEDCAAMPTPVAVAACWDRLNNSSGAPGMPSMGMNQPVLPPTVMPPMGVLPMGDPCMAITDPRDLQVCRASHQGRNTGMPPMVSPSMAPMGASGIVPPTFEGIAPSMALQDAFKNRCKQKGSQQKSVRLNLFSV
jgi:hypothetical protein